MTGTEMDAISPSLEPAPFNSKKEPGQAEDIFRPSTLINKYPSRHSEITTEKYLHYFLLCDHTVVHPMGDPHEVHS